jgi:hypothetical protein
MDFSKITSSVYEHLESSYDSKQGGFGGAPKFPTSCQFAYLLDYHHYLKKDGKEQAQKALDMVLFTLKVSAKCYLRMEHNRFINPTFLRVVTENRAWRYTW